MDFWEWGFVPYALTFLKKASLSKSQGGFLVSQDAWRDSGESSVFFSSFFVMSSFSSSSPSVIKSFDAAIIVYIKNTLIKTINTVAAYAIGAGSVLQLTSNAPKSIRVKYFFIVFMFFYFSGCYDNYFVIKVNINKKEEIWFILPFLGGLLVLNIPFLELECRIDDRLQLIVGSQRFREWSSSYPLVRASFGSFCREKFFLPEISVQYFQVLFYLRGWVLQIFICWVFILWIFLRWGAEICKVLGHWMLFSFSDLIYI